MKMSLPASDSSVYSVSSEDVMNGSWQKERHTAVSRLARDTETVVTATVENMNQRFTAVKGEPDALKGENQKLTREVIELHRFVAKLREVTEIQGQRLALQEQNWVTFLAWPWRQRWRWMVGK